jgi:multimeric flavodoxin WrbA
MKKIIVINTSPRVGMNTGTLVREAAKGAESEGAEVQVIDLYRLDKVHGCMSCFACKLKPNEGKCVFKDGLAPVLEAIRGADGLVIGTPNYLGDASAGFRALYERLIFQSLTYQMNPRRYDIRKIPVLFIMTSNSPKEFYAPLGYRKTVKNYQTALTDAVGNTKVMIAGNTLQVKDYSRFNWTMFDPAAKQEHHDKVFPEEMKKAFALGAEMVKKPW